MHNSCLQQRGAEFIVIVIVYIRVLNDITAIINGGVVGRIGTMNTVIVTHTHTHV